MGKAILRLATSVIAPICLILALPTPVQAWDHPSHMACATIAIEEIEKAHPDLVDKIGMLLMRHPDTAAF